MYFFAARFNGSFRSLFFLLVVLFSGQSNSHSQNYLWPTNASRSLTSSYCEFRPRHFHAAIDIKTWGRTGYRLFAIADGYVMRVRVSAFGYGKAVYLKLKDGNIVVYAHLDRFWPALEAYANRMRTENEQYRLNLHLNPDQFPVKQGQLIGYSGKSGIGFPHLHFEIRDQKNRPINPLQFYPDAVKDNINPKLYEIAFIPFNHRALINFNPDTLFYDLGRRDRYSLQDTVRITGQVALAIKVYDHAEGASNRFSFYQARMWIDDSLVYSVSYDRFSYAETKLVELDKNFALWRQGKGIFHNLFKHPANRLSHYRQTPSGGGLIDSQKLPDGFHHLKVEINDFSGNTAQFETNFITGNPIHLDYDLSRKLERDIFLRVQSPKILKKIVVSTRDKSAEWRNPPFSQTVIELKDRGIFHYTFAIEPETDSDKQFIRITGIDESGNPTFPLFISLHNPSSYENAFSSLKFSDFRFKKNWMVMESVYHSGGIRKKLASWSQFIDNLFWFPLNEQRIQIHLPVPQIMESREIYPEISNIPLEKYSLIQRRISKTVYSDDKLLSLNFPVNALYDESMVQIHTLEDTVDFNQSITTPYSKVGKIYSVQPYAAAVDQALSLTIRIPPDTKDMKGIGMYYWDTKKGWIFMPGSTDSSEATLHTRVTSLERFTLIRDTIPPVLIPLNVHEGQNIYGKGDKLRFRVKDEMSGIRKESQIQVFLDKRWFLFDYDPEEDIVLLDIDRGVRKPLLLEITITDNAGNVTIGNFQVY